MDVIVNSTLYKARKIAEDLHRMIIVKLVRQGGGSGRARLRAWLRNKSKIVALRDNLKDALERLWVALNVSSLCVIMKGVVSVVRRLTEAGLPRTGLNCHYSPPSGERAATQLACYE